LVLSSPLTVCLVMLGRHVPQLEFLDILMGDSPALDLEISFDQRLLARDQDEAMDLVLERAKAEPPIQVYDTMLVPALCATKRNRGRGDITPLDESFVIESIREIVEDLPHIWSDKSLEDGETGPLEPVEVVSAASEVIIFGCPARDALDRLGLEMLQKLLDPLHWRMELTAGQTLTAELLELVAQKKPALVCIAAIPPGGLAHIRYLCKRLRARFPELRIIVGRWGQEAGAKESTALLEEAGALAVTTTLLETRQQLATLLPVLKHSRDLTEEKDNAALKAAIKSSPRNGTDGAGRGATGRIGSQG
jgi:hypothetical protein